MTLIALVPMKGHSARVPGKNLRPLAGRPLFEWIVEALLGTIGVDRVVVDTDSDEIAQRVAAAFPEVEVHDRPEHLRGDFIPMHDIVAHLASALEGDVFLQTHATNPLLTSGTIGRAIEVHAGPGSHDSLMSVTPRRSRFYFEDGSPVNHDPLVLGRTQDLPPLFEENSNLYVAARDVILASRRRIGANPVLFPIGPEEAWDIDEELDFFIAEALLARRTP